LNDLVDVDVELQGHGLVRGDSKGERRRRKVSVKGVVVGVSWQIVLFAQLPIAAPVPL